MVRMPSVETLRVTHLSSSARKKRFCCKLGKKRRFVLILEWETLFPVIGRLPVNTHTLDILSEFWTAKVGIIPRFSKKIYENVPMRQFGPECHTPRMYTGTDVLTNLHICIFTHLHMGFLLLCKKGKALL
jgi:hypothetical protein